MAASLITTRPGVPESQVTVYTLAWVSHTDGIVDLDLDKAVVGEIVRVVFKPDAAGTQPTDLYDVLLKDAQGVDILGGQGANLSNVNATQVCPGVPLKDGVTTSVRPPVVNGILRLNVTNSGVSKGGTIVLYVR